MDDQVTTEFSLEQKLQALRRPEMYPGIATAVQAVQSHMSWVFLTDQYAFKLKKPVRMHELDFVSVTSRHTACRREVQLNRRLARHVYHGVLPLQVRDGQLHLGGEGRTVDWLVWMDRLPAEKMLDRTIGDGTTRRSDVRRVISLLADFYVRSRPVSISPAVYRHRMVDGVLTTRRRLLARPFGLSRRQVAQAAKRIAASIDRNHCELAGRVCGGHVIDAHGDLRPEHLCLTDPPVIIDCLEFSRRLRQQDTASEIAFLVMECEKLGDRTVGSWVRHAYFEFTGDDVSPELRRLYEWLHAFSRTYLAISHLEDADVENPTKWIHAAQWYLDRITRTVAGGAGHTESRSTIDPPPFRQ
ncbi:hypothetical protein FYK55_12665 [Roseiconus nitratireducens]|uniref:Aminoglycoside phosphotransferase domain-containing protein n=1 Tax=Roseiconus nitratireducens TaxID=2605748 RepID=A0A5M6D9M4_9BACT|nr:hypothetical protein [Roseiconus nitratireducens]KAA5543130.1 hypothetical protein FYK55_12665 [Roseiconus nitratireducens]